MEVIPLHSGVEVAMAVPPPSSVGNKDGIASPESPSGGERGSPT
jgi:hypothetical protein